MSEAYGGVNLMFPPGLPVQKQNKTNTKNPNFQEF
jgi:hypothetical protein